MYIILKHNYFVNSQNIQFILFRFLTVDRVDRMTGD